MRVRKFRFSALFIFDLLIIFLSYWHRNEHVIKNMFSFFLEASSANNNESKYGIERFKLCPYYPAPSVEGEKEVKEFNFHCGRE